MKCRVLYKPDGKVAVIHAAPNARKKGEKDAAFLNRVVLKATKGTELHNLPHEDINVSELPDRRQRNKWRKKAGGIKIDNTVILQSDKIKAIEDEIDIELDKQTPNIAKVLKLKRKIEKGDID